jgi:hypothetical protein
MRRQGSLDVLLTGAVTVLGCVLFAATARWLNPDIGYANSFNCDTWYFFGLQLNFHEIYNWKLYYQAFRFPALVPWIFLANRLNYETLNALKFFAYLIITSAGFFWFSARLFGTRVAAVVTVLFCCSTAFLGVLSSDYVTAAGVAWISLFLGATSEAAYAARPAWWGVVAGCFFGLAFYTHIPIALFVFSVPLIYFAGPDAGKGPAGFARYAAGGAAGFALMSAVCGLYNVSLGGDWFFLGPEIRYALVLARDAAASRPYRPAGFMWLIRETTVLTMLIGVLSSLAVLSLNLRHSNNRNTNLAAVVYLLIAVVTMGWEISGRTLLQMNVYAPWVFPTLFMAIGAALWQVKALREMSRQDFAVMLFVMAGILLFISTRLDAGPAQGAGPYFLRVALGGMFVLSSVIFRSSTAGLIAPACLTLFIAASYPSLNGYGSIPWYPGHILPGRDMTVQAAQAIQVLQRAGLTGSPAFWLDLAQPERMAIPRSYLYCSNFSAGFPSLNPGSGEESQYPAVTRQSVGEKRSLVVIASGQQVGELAAQRLRAIGFDSTSVGEWPIGSGRLKSTVAILRLTSR